HPQISFNIAASLAELHECSRAEEQYEALLRRDDLDTSLRSSVRDRLIQLDDCEPPSTVQEKPEPAIEVMHGVEPPPQHTWVQPTSYALMGGGVAMITWGILRDVSSKGRAEEMLLANQAGDAQRLAALEEEADSAFVGTAILYGVGLVALGGGIALNFWNFDSPGGDRQMGLLTRITPGHLSIELRW
ncbi:MAG: hypothetical protein ACNA8W_06285, partial [Bradymonadaceae bacterium]